MWQTALTFGVLRLTLTVAAVAATVLFDQAQAQTTPSAPGKPAAATPRLARPAWKDLTAAQKEALAPLAQDWDTFDRDRKQKWLEVAKKYPQLSPDAKSRMHERMTSFAKLSPEERRNVRENFRKAYELPIDQRQALIQEYKDLPAERKRELSDKANTSAPAAQKPTRASRRDAEQKKTDSR
jgi:hypothetical protein